MKTTISKLSISDITGFTLIEVMVALAIFAVAMASLSGALQNSATNATYIQEKTVAHWIASNALVDLQAPGNFPGLADRTDKVEFAGQEWVVRTKIEKSGAQQLPVRVAEISVGLEQGREVNYFATLNGVFADTNQ